MGCFFSGLNDDSNDDANFQPYNSSDTYNTGDAGTQDFGDQFSQQQYGAGMPQQQYDGGGLTQQQNLMATSSWQPLQDCASMPAI